MQNNNTQPNNTPAQIAFEALLMRAQADAAFAAADLVIFLGENPVELHNEIQEEISQNA